VKPSGRPRVPRAVAVFSLLAGVLLTGCSGGDDGAAPAPAASGSTAGTAPSGAPSGTSSTRTARPGPPPAETAGPKVATTTLPPVAVGERTSIAENVLVAVDGLRTLTVPATGPGETAGSAVAFTVEVRNGTDRPVDVGGFTVTAGYGRGTPAIPSSARPATPLTGSLAAGSSATGTYVFRMPADQVRSLQIQVLSDSSPNIVVVRG
jgi:hypothetical protein